MTELTHYEISDSKKRYNNLNAPVAQQVYSDKVLAMLAHYEKAQLPGHIISKWTDIVNDAAKRNDPKTYERYKGWLEMAGYKE